MISRLPHLALEIVLSGADMFLVGGIRLLAVVIVVVARRNYNLLGASLLPLLTSFGTSLSTFASSLGWCPSTAARDRLPITLDEYGPDRLFTKCVSGGNVKQLLCGLQLNMVEFMHYGLAAFAGPECWDDVGVTDLGEFIALLGESSDVILEEFAWILPATLQILAAARPHVCALEVVDEDLLEILPAINRLSRQVVKPGPSHVGQINGEELDNEEFIILCTHPACEAVVLQPNDEICLTVLFDDTI
jgi:hypothetical protein